jgi:hypothetical protein
MPAAEPNLPDEQQFVSISQSYEGLLPSRPSSTIGTNIFGDIWTSHKSLGSSDTNSSKQTPKFHTPGSVQGLEVELDEHRRVASIIQYAQNIVHR